VRSTPEAFRSIDWLAVTSRSFATLCTVIPAASSIKAAILLKGVGACNEGVARDDKKHCAYQRCANAKCSWTGAVVCEVIQHNAKRVGTGAWLRADPVAAVVFKRFFYGVLITTQLEFAKGAVLRGERLVVLRQTHAWN
jgi:hypothetical protein